MTIEDHGKVDAIGLSKSTGDVVLTIFDHLDWVENSDEHLLKLQEKLNSYLAFVESGELFETYPKAINKGIVFNVVGKFPLNAEAEEFYDKVRSIIGGSGLGIRLEIELPQN